MAGLLLTEYLEKQLARQPDHLALHDGSHSLTYRELYSHCLSIAHSLKQREITAQDRVVIFLPRSIRTVVAILGVLQANAVYLPLDHKTPPSRISAVLQDAGPAAVICDKTSKELLVTVLQAAQMSSVAILQLEDKLSGVRLSDKYVSDSQNANSRGLSSPDSANPSDYLAYILYTSGSTGLPKGVMISHANVNAYADWACRRFNITATDRMLSTAPFHFDMSTFDIYAALNAGATLYIASEALTLFPQKLVDFIEKHQITLWKGVASLLMYMARTGCLKPGSMPSLRQVMFAGEALPTKYLIDWMTIFPEKTFYNAYGPTEATGVSICYQINTIPGGPQQNIPIGIPRDDTGILLIDDERRQVAPGEIGELCISGPGLARGYFNDPVKTAQSFVINECGTRFYKTGDLARLTVDGNYEFVGRKDRQLKYMGYRIEAADIEKALLAIPAVRDAAVCLAASNEDDGVKKLVAFWEADEEITSTHIIAEMRSRLPVHMIPKTLIPIDQMPRCSRGKIDWNVLYGLLTEKP